MKTEYCEIQNAYTIKVKRFGPDNVVLPEDMRTFTSNNPLAALEVIGGADHRFKGKGQLEKVFDVIDDYLGKVLRHKRTEPSYEGSFCLTVDNSYHSDWQYAPANRPVRITA